MRDRLGLASGALVAETLLNLGMSIAFIQRDGVSRFVRGLGAEEYLSAYLVLVGLRVLLLAWFLLAVTSGKPHLAASE